MAGIAIRAAARKDAGSLARLCAALSAHEGESAPAFTAETVLRDGFGPNRAFELLVAETAGRLVGYALFYPVFDTQTAARGIHIGDLFVAAEARHRGVGRALMAAVARRARAAGGQFIAWNALAGNREAQAFYRTLGELEERVQSWSACGTAFAALAES
ncbi:MAG: GNAT family N-acetyltransferase [Kiloniellales bacterium]